MGVHPDSRYIGLENPSTVPTDRDAALTTLREMLQDNNSEVRLRAAELILLGTRTSSPLP